MAHHRCVQPVTSQASGGQAVRDELCLLPATEQARALRDGTCSARELVEAHLVRIERIDPLVNAIVTRIPG